MALVTVKPKFQVTIPAKLRKSAQLREGDILEASVVEGGILLRPKALVDREAVADRLEALLDNTPTAEEDVGKSDDEVMREAVSEVARARAARHKPAP